MESEEPKQVVVEREKSSSAGTIIAVVVGIIILIALAVYGLPYLTGGGNASTDVNIQAPAPTTGGQ
jgi:cell division septation protein DedD